MYGLIYFVLFNYGWIWGRLSDSPLSYTAWLMILNAVIFSILLTIMNKPQVVKKVFIEGKIIFFVGGTLSYTVYGTIVWAFTHASVPLVAALRETSIIFALLIGTFFLKEKFTPLKNCGGIDYFFWCNTIKILLNGFRRYFLLTVSIKMYSKFGQFIDGKWQTSANQETYEVINPATEEIIGEASKASPEDVDKALKSAEKGFEIWKKIKPWERSKIIRKIADEIRKKSKVFAKWMTLETGKTLAEGEAEAAAAADIFEWNAEETKRIYGQSLQSRFDNTKIQIIYQPVGVVAALSPWNFPLVLSARKVSAALAAGCSVICKPDVITPGTVMEMVDIIKDCGVPPGAVNLLSGDPAAITTQLLSSNIVKKVSITGSTRVGKIILKQAADKVQRVTMELSGHAPFIVFDDANIDKVTDVAMACKYRNNGTGLYFTK